MSLPKLTRFINKDNITSYVIALPILSTIFLLVFLLFSFIEINKETSKRFLAAQKEHILDDIKESLQDEVDGVIQLINFSIENPTLPLEQLKNVLLYTVSNMHFGEKGYFYIVDGEGELLAHPNEKLVGTNAFIIKDFNGKQYMKDIYNLSKTNGTGFYNYILVINKGVKEYHKKKITSYTYYPKFDWVVVAGAYLDDVDKEFKIQEKRINNDFSHEVSEIVLLSLIMATIVLFFSILLAYKIKRALEEEKVSIDLESANMQIQIIEQTSQIKSAVGFLEKIIEIIPIPIFVKDRHFRYTDCNKAFCEFFGKSKEDIIGKNIFDLTTQRLAMVHHQNDERLKKLKKETYKSRIEFANGEQKVAQFHKVANEYNYQFNGLVGVIIDITDSEKEKIEQQEFYQ